ncbi:cholinesterase-like protein [Schizothecium vesticola]|uniref:Carboxylic ester hydrolase n=1 Tax=Schizothecium vesticola TaxID=314040 RepID=A0AA40EKP0_9PEZI|nr:cholinesterase-like protein [Schizothecium vesticola]
MAAKDGKLALASLAAGIPSPKSLKTDVTILISNDLQGANSPFATSGVIFLNPRPYSDALTACQALGEQVWSPGLNTSSIKPNLDFLRFQGRISATSRLWIASNGNETWALDASGSISAADSASQLPVLCTQTAPFSRKGVQDTSEKWRVEVEANNQTLTGYRDRLSFRFFGIRYAPPPKRFTYPTLFRGSGESVSAVDVGPQCAQGSSGSGSEDCLFLNIWTPHLPSPGAQTDKKNLKPVGFWIHGGAFTGGTANDATFDGANIVSRGDMVLVAINYRLLALGFLALQDGITNGNFGLADQITALDWVRANIQAFGGDPDRITLFGQSAGAASVRAIMASPKAVGKFSGAIPLSNLGGINYGTTYSQYYTIDEQLSVVGNAILNATNCALAPSQVDCLRAVPLTTLLAAGTARYLVVDGTYLTTPSLPLTGPPLPISLMMGITRDDGAAFIRFPSPNTTNTTTYLASQGFSPLSPTLFPLPPLSNQTLAIYNTSSRLATDGIFRCIDQATAFTLTSSPNPRIPTGVYYYEFDRTYQTTGWPQTDVCEAPRTASHPNGDPSLPYFRCHSGELYYVFGNLARQGLPWRDEGDLPFSQLVLDLFSSFIRTGNPNPEGGYLATRGYEGTRRRLEEVDGGWTAARGGDVRLRVLDWKEGGKMEGFREVEQCRGLGLGVEEYYSGDGGDA